MKVVQLAVPVLATAALVIPATPVAAASPSASCVGQFSNGLAPQSAGAFGRLVSGLTQTAEPNFGTGAITYFAPAAPDNCP